MKQQQVVNAYKVIQKYQNEKLPLNVSLGLFKLKQALQPVWDFQVHEEQKIFDRYHPTQQEGSDSFQFSNDEDEQNFVQELGELLNMEADYCKEKFKIDFGDQINMPISDIEVLNDFIEF